VSGALPNATLRLYFAEYYLPDRFYYFDTVQADENGSWSNPDPLTSRNLWYVTQIIDGIESAPSDIVVIK